MFNKRLFYILMVGLVLIGCAEVYKTSKQNASLNAPNNALLVLELYRYAGSWVFDDARLGLVKEPFVLGIPEMIDKMVEGIPQAEKGFRLIFSAEPFPEHDLQLVWLRPQNGGNWYASKKDGTEGWICSAMYKYYKKAPKNLYIKAEPLNTLAATEIKR